MTREELIKQINALTEQGEKIKLDIPEGSNDNGFMVLTANCDIEGGVAISTLPRCNLKVKLAVVCNLLDNIRSQASMSEEIFKMLLENITEMTFEPQKSDDQRGSRQ